MGASYKARCLVLKKTKLGESDLILTMVDEEGHQVRGVAKGARKPGNRRFGARLEPYSLVDVVLYPGKSLETITEVNCIETNAECRYDLLKSSSCAIIAELLDKATRDGEVEPRCVQCASKAFSFIGAADANLSPICSCACLLKLAAMLGVRPSVRCCAACGGKLDEGSIFDLYSGGMVCSLCADSEPTHAREIAAWIATLLGCTFEELSSIENVPVEALFHFIDAWLGEYLGLRLKTIGFMLSSL